MCLAGEPIAALFRIPGFQHWFERGDAPGAMIEPVNICFSAAL